MLVFPSRDPSLGPGRALGFDRTILAGVGSGHPGQPSACLLWGQKETHALQQERKSRGNFDPLRGAFQAAIDLAAQRLEVDRLS